MNDDDLRARLHAMPEPTTAIDVDAVVADARRRRRPKVIGVGVAVGAACVAFLAPVVVPGLAGPDPVTSTLQEASDAGGDDAPAAEPTAGGDVPVCITPPDASAVVPGLDVAFGDDPDDGAAQLVLANANDTDLTVGIGEVGTIVHDGGLLATSTDLDLDAPVQAVTIAAGQTTTLEVDIAPGRTACGFNPTDQPIAPRLVIVVDGVPSVVMGTASTW